MSCEESASLWQAYDLPSLSTCDSFRLLLHEKIIKKPRRQVDFLVLYLFLHFEETHTHTRIKMFNSREDSSLENERHTPVLFCSNYFFESPSHPFFHLSCLILKVVPQLKAMMKQYKERLWSALKNFKLWYRQQHVIRRDWWCKDLSLKRWLPWQKTVTNEGSGLITRIILSLVSLRLSFSSIFDFNDDLSVSILSSHPFAFACLDWMSIKVETCLTWEMRGYIISPRL